MKYADFIKGNEGFQYSINIQYDLMNPNKINGYIPTRKSVEIYPFISTDFTSFIIRVNVWR